MLIRGTAPSASTSRMAGSWCGAGREALPLIIFNYQNQPRWRLARIRFELSRSDRERFHAVSLFRPLWLLSASASGHYADISRVDQFFNHFCEIVDRCGRIISINRWADVPGGKKPR